MVGVRPRSAGSVGLCAGAREGSTRFSRCRASTIKAAPAQHQMRATTCLHRGLDHECDANVQGRMQTAGRSLKKRSIGLCKHSTTMNTKGSSKYFDELYTDSPTHPDFLLVVFAGVVVVGPVVFCLSLHRTLLRSGRLFSRCQPSPPAG